MNQSSTLGNLAAALAAAQAMIRGAVKDSANPFFKSSYADLQSVWDAIRQPLATNGLCVVQSTSVSATGQLLLVTTLIHKSGEWISGEYPIVPVKAEPQAYGSALSYGRRYALAAMCGVYQVDDDGEAAQARPTAPSVLRTVVETAPPAVQVQVAKAIDESLTKAQAAKHDELIKTIIITQGVHAGKRINELSFDEAGVYFQEIESKLKAVNRSPETLRGPSKDVYFGLKAYITGKGQA